MPRLKKLDDLIADNIETVKQIENSFEEDESSIDVVANKVAQLIGRPLMIQYHIAFYGAWIGVNTLPWFPKFVKFDPPPFGLLSVIVGIESILLTSCILLSQERIRKVGDNRNRLNLQISLLAEQEASQMLVMLRALCEDAGRTKEANLAHELSQVTDVASIADRLVEADLSIEHAQNSE